MSSPRLLAAVDLGSNSFRLLIGRVQETPHGAQVYPLDSLKETVRLASGLSKEKRLDAESQQRAYVALERFGERLRSFAPDQVRAVATNTLRVAKNSRDFLEGAEKALGFPIEVIAGREEARLIYSGVSHTFPPQAGEMLVVDIGGGSTEFIIGTGHEPRLMESLFMGCVGYSLQFFPGGEVDRYNWKQAELAAQKEVEVIARDYIATGWQLAVGSSGTAKALGELMNGSNGAAEHAITREGLASLRDLLLKAGSAQRLKLEALKPDRIPVLPGGLAIMSAVFTVLGIDRMEVSDGALRQGVLYDLLGRSQQQDMRDVTVEQFTQRYSIDRPQARRVAALAVALLQQAQTGSEEHREAEARILGWSAALHEIGLSISHAGYHKHSAYILSNADMPGFSKMDQVKLAALVLGHTGKLTKLSGQLTSDGDWMSVLCLRLAVLLYRRRTEAVPPEIRLSRTDKGYAIQVDSSWLSENPLTEFSLRQECLEWGRIGLVVELT